jgi:hypothetical protein
MNQGSLRGRILDSLPGTIRDAIMATEKLEERYLWIDSICIQQDNEQEKQEQINIMDWVYGNATLTLAADAPEAAAGLRGVQHGSRNLAQLKIEMQTGEYIIIPLPEPKCLESSIWNSRAWTLQERLLSRRLMIFIGGEVVWRCRETVAFEDMTAEETGIAPEAFPWLSIKPQYLGINARKGYVDGSIVRSRDGGTEVMRSATFTEYVKVVEEYAHRKITHPSDILKALAGILQILERCFKYPTNHGLSEGLLDAAILWRPSEILERRQKTDIDIPSWSWAGWIGRVEYEKRYVTEVDQQGHITRIPKEFGPEHFRSLLRWYTCKTGTLELLNGNGFGIPLDGDDPPLEWDQNPFEAALDPYLLADLLPETPSITRRHLIF